MLLALIIGIVEYVQMDALAALVLAVAIFLIAIILELDNRGMLESERFDFRRKIIPEALSILDRLILVAHEPIACTVWSSRAEGFKTDALGKQDYARWKEFYDDVEARNGYFTPRESFVWSDVEKFARACFISFFKVYDEIPWVREAIPQATITDLLSRAKRSASTCGFARESEALC
jgi:hypothetical protein